MYRSSDWPWEEFGVTTKVKKQEVAPPDNAPKRRRGRPAVSKPVPRRTKQRKVKQGLFRLQILASDIPSNVENI